MLFSTSKTSNFFTVFRTCDMKNQFPSNWSIFDQFCLIFQYFIHFETLFIADRFLGPKSNKKLINLKTVSFKSLNHLNFQNSFCTSCKISILDSPSFTSTETFCNYRYHTEFHSPLPTKHPEDPLICSFKWVSLWIVINNNTRWQR